MFLYNTGVFLYTFVIHITSLFNPKAKLWVQGRRDWKNKLSNGIQKIKDQKRIWIHCASLGEFEQGRPVIEKIKQLHPEIKIILSFFSPSGYEIRKDYEFADVICYLPSDTKQNASDFIEICKPQSVIFVKYEFWLNYLFEIKKQNIPSYLISAVIRKHQPFFKWYGNAFIKGLYSYKTIFVQDNESLKLLESLEVRTGQVCGDTRIDRVIKIQENSKENVLVREFTESNYTIIAGSTWPKDNALLIGSFNQIKKQNPKLKLIIATHEVDNKCVKELESLIQQQKLNYSLYTKGKVNSTDDILIINTIGVLSSIYKYGKLAYIGGGFNNGIHNVLEPAVCGMPVLFGPNHSKFNEANQLISAKAAFEINNEEELINCISSFIQNNNKYTLSCQSSLNYIYNGKGATEKIVEQLYLAFN